MTTALDSDARAEASGAADPFRQNMVAIIPSLRAFARGLCGDRDMADDLAQEAIMRAWRARESYTEGTNFRAWMFKIVRNLFYTAHRKNARMSSWDPEAAERLLVAPPTQHVGIDVADVAEALNRLPAEQREVLMLVGAGGMSYEEAANVAGCAIGTIKSRLARGRAALIKLVEGSGEIDRDMEARTEAQLVGFD